MSHSEWWRGMPVWLKLVYLLVAIPAWVTIVYCVLTGQSKNTTALVALSVFVGATLLHIVYGRHVGEADDGGGIGIGGD